MPSLIPLLFALVVFFGTFSFALSNLNLKNTDFKDDLTVLEIAKTLKGTSYVSSYATFQNACKTLNITELKFRAGITNFFTTHPSSGGDGLPGEYTQQHPESDLSKVRVYNVGFYFAENDSSKELACDNLSAETRNRIENNSDAFFSDKEVIARIYPLVLEDNRIVKPMHLVVVAWRS